MSTYVAVFALVLAYVALVAAYFALRTLAKLRRATAALGRTPGRRDSLLEAVHQQAELGEATRAELAELRSLVAAAQTAADSAADAAARAPQTPSEPPVPPTPAGVLRNVALVRYDAFDGLAGRMSFSLAVLDDAGDGVTLSALAGQSDTRVYAKSVTAGRPSDGGPELSPEEHQAVRAALDGRPRQGRRLTPRKAG